MAVRKILITSNSILRQVKYKRGSTEIASGQSGGVCRTMVLSWIHESLMGRNMNNMGGILTGGGFSQIAWRHESTKFRMRWAKTEEAKDAVRKDILHAFKLKQGDDPVLGKTAVLVGVMLDPDSLDVTNPIYALLTVMRGDGSGGHALGLAFSINGLHYLLDPNSGLYEYDTLEDMFGLLGHTKMYVMTNYATPYPDAQLQTLERM